MTSSPLPEYRNRDNRDRDFKREFPESSVFVGGLPHRVSERSISELFEKHGTVAKLDIKKGYCFIEFKDRADAQESIRKLHGTDFEGHKITVEFTKGPQRHHKPPIRTGYRVVVDNIPSSITWQDLKDHMRRVGNVGYTDIIKDSNGRSKGYGVAEYNTYDEMKTAIKELDGTKLKDSRITVEEDRSHRGGFRRRRPPSPSYERRRNSRSPSPRYRRRRRSPPSPSYRDRKRYDSPKRRDNDKYRNKERDYSPNNDNDDNKKSDSRRSPSPSSDRKKRSREDSKSPVRDRDRSPPNKRRKSSRSPSHSPSPPPRRGSPEKKDDNVKETKNSSGDEEKIKSPIKSDTEQSSNGTRDQDMRD